MHTLVRARTSVVFGPLCSLNNERGEKKGKKKKTVFSRACAGKQRPVAEIHSNSRAASCNTHDEKKNSNK